ncbi:hypothetical protein G7054_g6996 [Neopestalotiopsis clavispora]|nr:hypothetical protein G7054_g6996 [Neopestalotiopsis clavispora]
MLANPHSPTENRTEHFAAHRGGYSRDGQQKDGLRPSPELVVRPEATGDDISQPSVHPTHQPKPTRIESRQIGRADEQSQSRKIQQSDWEQPSLVPSKRAVLVQHKNRVYKDDEWEVIKPVLYELYMEQCLSLERVIQIMSQVHNFHATKKMYKHRFLRRWNWRKNRSKGCELSDAALRPSGSSRARRVAAPTTSQITRIRSPDALRTQELSLHASKVYTRAQFDSHGWRHGPFTIRGMHHQAGSNGVLDFFALETLSIYAMHQMVKGDVISAYSTLNTIFDGMNGIWSTLHPKLLMGFWLLLRKAYDICVLARDDEFELLRVFMRYHGHAANQYLTEEHPGSLNPLPRLIMALVEMSKREPGLIERVLRYCSIAAADSLEEKIGLDHPTVLLAWGNNYWYWKVPALFPSKNLKARFQAVIARGEEELEPASPLLIGMLFDYALVLFHNNEHHDDERMIAKDLLSRTEVHVRAGPPAERSQVTRAHASATILACIHALEDGDVTLSEELFSRAIKWFSSGGPFMKMYAEMVMRDRETLMQAWGDGKGFRAVFLNFVRPRCIDMERETMDG